MIPERDKERLARAAGIAYWEHLPDLEVGPNLTEYPGAWIAAADAILTELDAMGYPLNKPED